MSEVTLERGFRRLAIVISVVVLGLGFTLDAMTMRPHATVQVTLKDGRKFTVQRHEAPHLLTARDEIAGALPKSACPPARFASEDPEDATSPLWMVEIPGSDLTIQVRARTKGEAFLKTQEGRILTRDPPDITDLHVLHAGYWWWADTVWTKAAVGLVAFLWVVFYGVRWVVRGFAGA
jgi:hypothetical protein